MRYWVSSISRHVIFGLLSCTRILDPTRNEFGVLGFLVFFGVEQGGRIGTCESSPWGILWHFTPIFDELSFGYPLVPLSVFLDMADFFDIFVMLPCSDNITFEDIMSKDVRGVGWGAKSLRTLKLSWTLESLTPGVDLSMLGD